MTHVKTAISLPDSLFQRLQDIAAAENISRSAVVAIALERYFEAAGNLTELIDRVLDSLSDEEQAEERAHADGASRRSLERLRTGERW